MEFVAGRTLDGVLATDGLPDASVVRIGMQLADALDHAHQHGIIGQAYEQKGMYPEAIAALEKAVELSDGNLVMTAALAHAWALAGKRPEAQKVVDRLSRVSQDGYFSPYFIAEIHVALGHTEEALAWLDKAYEARDYFLRWLKIDPRLDPLRSDPRFQSLERRLNYPA